jgi:predicted CoA-binding protein
MRHCNTKHDDALDETICSILMHYKRIAVVGLSSQTWRDSYRVARYMIGAGYRIEPVNPTATEVLGLKSYPDLASVPGPIEVVNVFRRIEHVPGIIDEAIRAGAKAVWTQLGLYDEQAGERARKAGLLIVMDRCIMVEHRRHLG